jgi:hypothetical protein
LSYADCNAGVFLYFSEAVKLVPQKKQQQAQILRCVNQSKLILDRNSILNFSFTLQNLVVQKYILKVAPLYQFSIIFNGLVDDQI